MHVPNLQDSYVQAFCKSISEDSPALIKFQPQENAPQNDCFILVEQHIQQHGGSKVIGWAVWEWPKVMIEAEFHCAWKSPDGELIDISPRWFLSCIFAIPLRSILWQKCNLKTTVYRGVKWCK